MSVDFVAMPSLAGGLTVTAASVLPACSRARRTGKFHSPSYIFSRSPNPPTPMNNHRRAIPAHFGYLLDELRVAGVTTYADLATTLNQQGLRPSRGRWTAHALQLAMRRHRRAHPAASESAGIALYRRRAEQARRVIRRLQRRGLKTQGMLAKALNARGLRTPGLGRLWTARSVSRVLAA